MCRCVCVEVKGQCSDVLLRNAIHLSRDGGLPQTRTSPIKAPSLLLSLAMKFSVQVGSLGIITSYRPCLVILSFRRLQSMVNFEELQRF